MKIKEALNTSDLHPYGLGTLRAMLRSFMKKSGDAWLSPPSAWMGSMTIPATGLPFCLHFTIRSST